MGFKFKNKKTVNTKKEDYREPSVVTAKHTTHKISEQFRTIRTNIQLAKENQNLKTLAVTSSVDGEGKTMVASNLGAVMASAEQRVLLVDTDFRKPTLHRIFKSVDKNKGLSHLLMNDTLDVTDAISFVNEANLYVLPAGPKPTAPSELLSSQKMKLVINEIKDLFDIVIFDTPAVMDYTDAQIVASQVDGTVVVIREGLVERNELKETKTLLERVDSHIIGAIYNDSKNQ